MFEVEGQPASLSRGSYIYVWSSPKRFSLLLLHDLSPVAHVYHMYLAINGHPTRNVTLSCRWASIIWRYKYATVRPYLAQLLQQLLKSFGAKRGQNQTAQNI